MAIGEPAWDGLLVLARSRTSGAAEPAALLLARQGVPQVTSVLMTMLTEDPSNPALAAELAILTGRDFRDQPDPAGSWWAWSDGVVGGDSIDWFVGGILAEVEAGLAMDLVDVELDADEIRAGSLAGARGLVQYLRQLSASRSAL